LNAFLERIRKALGHDLRTPLGTIANYAAVLEATLRNDGDDVRRLAQNIRANAMGAAKMLEQTLGALLLAARPPSPAPFDAPALLAKIARELAHGIEIVGDRTTPAEGGAFQFDPGLVAFVWKIFVDLVRFESPAMARKAWIERRDEDDRALLVLSMGREDVGAAASPLENFLAHEPPDDAPVRRFGLALCRELVTVRGGAFEVAGRAGAEVVLRLGFPSKCAN
jgi:signal transduction histidine kinase